MSAKHLQAIIDERMRVSHAAVRDVQFANDPTIRGIIEGLPDELQLATFYAPTTPSSYGGTMSTGRSTLYITPQNKEAFAAMPWIERGRLIAALHKLCGVKFKRAQSVYGASAYVSYCGNRTFFCPVLDGGIDVRLDVQFSAGEAGLPPSCKVVYTSKRKTVKVPSFVCGEQGGE